MIVYRISCRRRDDEEHTGYYYVRTMAEVIGFARHRQSHTDCTVRQFKIPVTRKGLLWALNQFGTHPDNG